MNTFSQLDSSNYNSQTYTSRRQVLNAIQQASDKSGVDFNYLVTKADQESSLDPSAKASGSSATGLYQFIDQTWLKTVKENGAKYGLGAQADQITIGSDGMAHVDNAADRKAILAMRKDPVVSSEMAAELTKSNKEALETKIGGQVGATELYLAHFLGANGASQLLQTMKSNPNASAAAILPQAAQANKSVFYDSETGKSKTVTDIYQHFAQKFDGMPATGGPARQIASIANGAVTARDQVLTKMAQQSHTSGSVSPVASGLAGSGSTSGTVTLANGLTLDKGTSTPFATMLLAQMDMDSFGHDAADASYKVEKQNGNQERMKSVLKTLSNAA